MNAYFTCACVCVCAAMTDWHKAGKGPDPNLAKLDADMDSYFAKKGEAAAVTEVEGTAETEAVTTEAVAVPETVAE